MAYGRLRRIWYTHDWSTVRDVSRKWEEKDREIRRGALVGNRIVNLRLPPRRVWDLCSNRVVPWWSVDYWPKAISHAWVGEKDRVDVQTPIKGYEWPVPIPNDTSLDLVRIEMLNLGLEHVWLDVLCLRQVGGPGEDMRREEWKLDVPTIGAVYHQNRVVWYLSGLGRPLSLKEGDLESDRCWFRRAWTLQEVGMEREIAGDTPDGPMHAVHDGWKYETELLTRFHEQLWSMEHILDTRFLMLENMRNRVSTNPVDKVAGLAFCLFSKTIPAYYENESVEEAWSALVNSMDAWGRGELFSLYPEPGNAGTKWRPSWDQLMMKPLPPSDSPSNISIDRVRVDEDWCNAYCIEKGLVRGLAVVDSEGIARRGQLIVQGAGVTEYTFSIMATHEYLIPENAYTLIRVTWSFQYWVIGKRLSGRRFEKVSTLEIHDIEDRNRLRDLFIIEECRNIILV
ncbi:hypothetical protein ARMSODRAFT_961974 [Armillaria solidipes]|uniref:Heterokaryon incompatibility domain-containing protein n=1 Tax=Armillaria solidipes TaxID=1076256 RepID=A0A2H3B0Q3_9AGAR|nr:hypothetical protein ARMSODRAFT_961974 [Armillaria solidipes]